MSSICLLASGHLGFQVLQHLYDSPYQLVAVFTDKRSTNITDFCAKQEIPVFIGNPRNGKARSFIKTIDCEVLLSVNYLFIVEEDLLRIPKQYAINLHGSLLPKYRGRTPHVWAIINGEKETGVTAHLMQAEVDSGAIVRQIRLPIHEMDTGAAILAKFNTLYPDLVDAVLADVAENKVQLVAQDDSQATYFGKRTPADGQIDWSWGKERIVNWVRAQAKPYPGAFAFYEGKKVTIHKAAFSAQGFHFEDENGLILAVLPEGIIVKTPTGALLLSELEMENSIVFEKGKKLT